jgi:Major Facilitator Superfamily
MYTSESSPARADPAPRPRVWSGMPLNVWALGLTSLLTDVSSEMVTSVLPLYVVLHLQWSPMAFGALDGAYQGVATLVRLGSGVVADRWRSHKAVALAGYACSAVAKAGYMAAGAAWPALTAALVADRLGKGVRTAPRDALIAASAPVGRMGAAFGLHRTMDAAGAAAGPALVFALLVATPDRFDVVFLTSFWIAVTGVAAMALLVDGRPSSPAPRPRLAWSRLGDVWLSCIWCCSDARVSRPPACRCSSSAPRSSTSCSLPRPGRWPIVAAPEPSSWPAISVSWLPTPCWRPVSAARCCRWSPW